MESNPKEIKMENEEIDRISELPDSILCKILSYLPTKNAVGASVLSTRWKTISPFDFMPITLELDDFLLLNPRKDNSNSPSGSFMGFVDKLLNETLSDVPSVEKVNLKCKKDYGDAKVAFWVCAAAQLNVQHLDLKLWRNKSTSLFHSFNGCTTLVTLRLSLERYILPPWCELHVPDNFILPNLKSLDLAKLALDDGFSDPIEQLIKGCPVLEYLHLVRIRMQGGYDVSIESPLLKKLDIENCWEVMYLSHLVINAPNLELFIYNNFLARDYGVCNFNSLHTAHIDIGPNRRLLDLVEEHNDDEGSSYSDNAAMIVSRCSSTIRLYLSDRTIDVLNLSFMRLPVFQNLIWLSLGRLQWAILARLLSITPNLETLIIEEGLHNNEGGFANFMSLLPFPPECFLLHVKRIELLVFKGDEDEIMLVEFFLKNGVVLQNLTLRCLPLDDLSTFARLLMLPRRSQMCQIECKEIEKRVYI